MINFEKQTWYNKNDPNNQDKRIPISASHLNRIEDGVDYSVRLTNEMFNYMSSYWWRKYEVTGVALRVINEYTNHIEYPWTTKQDITTFYYSDSVSITYDETARAYRLKLDNYSSVDVSYNLLYGMAGEGDLKLLSGKYFVYGSTNPDNTSTVHHMASGGRIRFLNYSATQFGYEITSSCEKTFSVVLGDPVYVESDKKSRISFVDIYLGNINGSMCI